MGLTGEAWVAWSMRVCTGRSVVPTDGARGKAVEQQRIRVALPVLRCGVEGGWRLEMGGPGSAPDLFPPEDGPFVLKPDNGAARRAKTRQNLPHVSCSRDW